MSPTAETEADLKGEGPTLRIGQLAKLASVNVETLRFYEREGLLEKPYQHLSGYRAYPVSAVGHVRSIKRAQALGFSLSEIRSLLKGTPGQRFSDQATRKLAEIDGMMAGLQRARADLARLLEYGCDGLVGCSCGQSDCPTRAQQVVTAPAIQDGDAKPVTAKAPGLLAGVALTASCAACCAPLVAVALAVLGVPALAATEGLEIGLAATALTAAGIGLNRMRRRTRARAVTSG
jgi:DNA-binding transcriptional MerR regulator